MLPSLNAGNVQPACKHVNHVRTHKIAQPRATAFMCHGLSSLWKISIWKGGGEWVRVMCQELTQLITATERMAKSSGDLITWNNCRCSSSSPLAAINLYDFSSETLSCWLPRL